MIKDIKTVPVKIYERNYQLPVFSRSGFGELQQRIQSRQETIKEGKREDSQLFGFFRQQQKVSFEERLRELNALVNEYQSVIKVVSTTKEAYIEFFVELVQELEEIITKKCQDLAQTEQEREQLEVEWQHDELLSSMYQSQKEQINKSVFLLGEVSLSILEKIKLIRETIQEIKTYHSSVFQVWDEMKKRLTAYQKTYELQQKFDQVERQLASLSADAPLNFEEYITQASKPFENLNHYTTEVENNLIATVTEIQELVKQLSHESGQLEKNSKPELSEKPAFVIPNYDQKRQLKTIHSPTNANSASLNYQDLEILAPCLRGETLFEVINSLQTRFTSELAREVGQSLNLTSIENNETRIKLASHLNIPTETLQALAQDSHWQVREKVVTNPNLSVETLEQLAQDHYWQVRQGVASNPNTPVAILQRLARDDYWQVRQEVARNFNTPLVTLEQLIRDHSGEIRKEAAQNHNWLPEQLQQLARNHDKWIREGVAGNAKTAVETLQQLVRDEEGDICREAAKNLNWSREQLQELAHNWNMWIREGVAENPKTPVTTLYELAQDHDMWVRKRVAGNRNAPVETLQQLAQDHNWKVRKQVASHPNTPRETLKQLATDRNSLVRQSADRALEG
jgi:hypothetical protein